jgi:hypothetical protein
MKVQFLKSPLKKFMFALAVFGVIGAQVTAQAQVVRGNYGFEQLRNTLRSCAQYSNLSSAMVCVGSVLLDGLEIVAMRSATPPAPVPGPIYRQKMVGIYANNDRCSGALLGSVVLTGDFTQDIATCERTFAKSGGSWSISVNGRCIDINDTSPFGACSYAITANPQ